MLAVPFTVRLTVAADGWQKSMQATVHLLGPTFKPDGPLHPLKPVVHMGPWRASAVRASGPLFPANVFSKAQAGDRIVVLRVLAEGPRAFQPADPALLIHRRPNSLVILMPPSNPTRMPAFGSPLNAPTAAWLRSRLELASAPSTASMSLPSSMCALGQAPQAVCPIHDYLLSWQTAACTHCQMIFASMK